MLSKKCDLMHNTNIRWLDNLDIIRQMYWDNST